VGKTLWTENRAESVYELRSAARGRRLDLSGLPLKDVDLLADWPELRYLKELDLSKYEALENVDGVSGLTCLRRILLRECGALSNVNGLAGLLLLDEVDLFLCESLANVNALAGLTQLTRLDLSFCSSLPDVNILAGLTQLTVLHLDWCSRCKLNCPESAKGINVVNLFSIMRSSYIHDITYP